jgi:hypothetical protein
MPPVEMPFAEAVVTPAPVARTTAAARIFMFMITHL